MKRLIEVDFPIFEVSEHSAREKNIRHGHISTLHIWWARRPLAACRAAIYASLVPAPDNENELKEKMKFIAELSKWENSLNKKLIDKARKDILDANGGKPPKILDCFAGGGSIPLEALRLGCETYALELNPVAVLILKATIEYPQKYGKKLVKDVEKWGKWILKEARKEIGKFYPEETEKGYFSSNMESKGEKWIPVGYIWARTIKCQNPACGAEIPLMRQFWLRKKMDNDKKIIWKDSIYLKPVIDKENKKIDFEIIEGRKLENFDPSKGTRPTAKAKASFKCPICGTIYKSNDIRKYAKREGLGERMVCVVLHNANKKGKRYRIVNEKDIKIFEEAKKALEEKIENWEGEYDPIPDEAMPHNPRSIWVTLYLKEKEGAVRFGQLFNSRQLLTLITFIEKVKEAYKRMLNEGYDKEYAKIVGTYLSFIVNRLSDRNSTLCRLIPQTQAIGYTFARQALPMVWDYIEMNPFENNGGWEEIVKSFPPIFNHCNNITNLGNVYQGTATSLSSDFRINFDAIITDPPYYDNVPYADLSDFFYVWLKRSIGEFYPDLFSTPLTPKSEEIIQEPMRHNKDTEKAKKFYQDMMSKAFREMSKVLKPNGITTIIFAHTSTEAWEALINALVDAGLVPVTSWPIHTERGGRPRSMESAALASSFFLTCRKRKNNDEAYFKDIRKELEERIRERLDHFWKENIRGADFFISAIGPAVEIYGKYSKVKKLSGEEMSASDLLNYVREYVTEYALSKILKGIKLEKIDPITRFYILWRWTYNGQTVEYDDARKLSQALGVELDKIWGEGSIVKKSGGKIQVLSPKDRKLEDIKDKPHVNLIDALHKACLLWEAEKTKELENYLRATGYLNDPLFWETAQALSEILPKGDKEKIMIQGLLFKAPVVIDSKKQMTLERWSK